MPRPLARQPLALPPLDPTARAASITVLRAILSTCPQKRAILELLLLGLSEKQIAHVMDLSPHTIHGHFSELFGRLRVRNKVSLALLAKEVLESKERQSG